MPIPSLADLLDRLNEDEAVDAPQAESEAVAAGPALKCRESAALRSNEEPWYTQLAKSRAREQDRIEMEFSDRTVVSATATSNNTAPPEQKGRFVRERLTFGPRRTGGAPPKHKAEPRKAKAAPSRGSVMLPGSSFDASQRADAPWSLLSSPRSRASASSAPAFPFSSTSSSAGSGLATEHPPQRPSQEVGPGSMKSLLTRSLQAGSGESAAVCGPAAPDEQASLVCNHCAGPSAKNSFRCSRCQSVYYCSPECQRRDWRSHKPQCDQQAQRRDLGQG